MDSTKRQDKEVGQKLRSKLINNDVDSSIGFVDDTFQAFLEMVFPQKKYYGNIAALCSREVHQRDVTLFSNENTADLDLRVPRFRMLLAKGSNQVDDFLNSYKTNGMVARNETFSTFICDFYNNTFQGNEKEHIRKLENNNDVWHLVLIGLRKHLNEEANLEVIPSFMRVIACVSFQPFVDLGTIVLLWIAVSDSPTSRLIWGISRNLTEKNSFLSRFFDNSGTFRNGKQIGITLVCIMHYVCGLMNKNQNTYIPTEAACRKIILQASIQALPFYKYGLGFNNMTQFDKGLLHASIKALLMTTDTLVTIESKHPVKTVRPFLATQTRYFNVGQVVNFSLTNLYLQDDKDDPDLYRDFVFDVRNNNDKDYVPSCFVSTRNKAFQSQQYSISSSNLPSDIRPNQRLNFEQSRQVLYDILETDETQGDEVELVPISIGMLPYLLTRMLVFFRLSNLKHKQLHNAFNSPQPKGTETDDKLHSFLDEECFPEIIDFDLEKQFLTTVAWCLAHYATGVSEQDYNSDTKYKKKEERGVEIWYNELTPGAVRPPFETDLMRGPLISQLIKTFGEKLQHTEKGKCCPFFLQVYLTSLAKQLCSVELNRANTMDVILCFISLVFEVSIKIVTIKKGQGETLILQCKDCGMGPNVIGSTHTEILLCKSCPYGGARDDELEWSVLMIKNAVMAKKIRTLDQLCIDHHTKLTTLFNDEAQALRKLSVVAASKNKQQANIISATNPTGATSMQSNENSPSDEERMGQRQRSAVGESVARSGDNRKAELEGNLPDEITYSLSFFSTKDKNPKVKLKKRSMMLAFREDGFSKVSYDATTMDGANLNYQSKNNEYNELRHKILHTTDILYDSGGEEKQVSIEGLKQDILDQFNQKVATSNRHQFDSETDCDFNHILRSVKQKLSVEGSAMEKEIEKKEQLLKKTRDRAKNVALQQEKHQLIQKHKQLVHDVHAQTFFTHPDSLVAIRYNNKIFEGLTKKVFMYNSEESKHLWVPLTKLWVTQHFDPEFIKLVKSHAEQDGYIHLNQESNVSEQATEYAKTLYEQLKGKKYTRQFYGDDGVMVIVCIRVTCTFRSTDPTLSENKWELKSISRKELLSMKTNGLQRELFEAIEHDRQVHGNPTWLKIDEDFLFHDQCAGKIIPGRLLALARTNYRNKVSASGRKHVSVNDNGDEVMASPIHYYCSKECYSILEKRKLKLEDITNFPIYELGEKQVASIKYDAEKQTYYGSLISTVRNGRVNYERDVPLATEWVTQNISHAFLKTIQNHSINKKYLYIPAGNSTFNREYPYGYDTNLPKIQFLQEQRNTCATSSFGSCLFFLGYQELGIWMENFGRKYVMNEENDQSRILQSIVDHLHLQHVEFRRAWNTRKISNDNFDIYSTLSATEKFTIQLLQPIGSDGGVGHAITIFNGMIFDSNLDYAVQLNSLNLEFCISAVYSGIICGYYFTPNKSSKKHKKKMSLKHRTTLKNFIHEIPMDSDEKVNK